MTFLNGVKKFTASILAVGFFGTASCSSVFAEGGDKANIVATVRKGKKEYNQFPIVYNDNFFEKSAYEYSDKLSAASLALEMSSFSASTQKEKKADNVKAALKALEFAEECISVNGEYTEDSKPDSIGVAVANKQIKVTENGENKEYTLIPVVVRGGGYAAEWAGNFNVGKSGNHDGFEDASKKVKAFVDNYMQKNKIKGDVKLWIVGYSRGGAVAGLVGHKYNQQIRENAQTNQIKKEKNAYNLTQDNIYTYTFEAPKSLEKFKVVDTENNKKENNKKENNKKGIDKKGIDKKGIEEVKLTEGFPNFIENYFGDNETKNTENDGFSLVDGESLQLEIIMSDFVNVECVEHEDYNIHNIIHDNDIVTKIPPDGWGLVRPGQEHKQVPKGENKEKNKEKQAEIIEYNEQKVQEIIASYVANMKCNDQTLDQDKKNVMDVGKDDDCSKAFDNVVEVVNGAIKKLAAENKSQNSREYYSKNLQSIFVKIASILSEKHNDKIKDCLKRFESNESISSVKDHPYVTVILNLFSDGKVKETFDEAIESFNMSVPENLQITDVEKKALVAFLEAANKYKNFGCIKSLYDNRKEIKRKHDPAVHLARLISVIKDKNVYGAYTKKLKDMSDEYNAVSEKAKIFDTYYECYSIYEILNNLNNYKDKIDKKKLEEIQTFVKTFGLAPDNVTTKTNKEIGFELVNSHKCGCGTENDQTELFNNYRTSISGFQDIINGIELKKDKEKSCKEMLIARSETLKLNISKIAKFRLWYNNSNRKPFDLNQIKKLILENDKEMEAVGKEGLLGYAYKGLSSVKDAFFGAGYMLGYLIGAWK